MAHNLEIVDGQASMMFAGEAPWHGLGVNVQKEVTSAAAIKAAGLDWNVSTRDVYFANKDNVMTKFEGRVATIRDTDDAQLGVGMSDRYRVVQNVQAFDMFDSLVGEKAAIYHTAGSLAGGKRIWILAKLPESIVVTKDDVVDKYILLSNSHDGTTATRIFWTPVRVVCQNTESAALRGFSTKDGIAIRHTANAAAKMEDAREVLGLANAYYSKVGERFIEMAKTKFSEKQMKEMVEKLFPVKEGEVSTRTQNIRDTVLNLFENGIGQENVRGTEWACYNAFTEFADHHKGTRITAGRMADQARLDSIWFGSGNALKLKAFDYLNVK